MTLESPKTCPRCGFSNLVKDGFIAKKQRYRCKGCDNHFTVTMRKQRIDQNLKRNAMVLYLCGFSITKIEDLTGVKQTTLFKWVKDLGPKFELMRATEKLKIKTIHSKSDKIIRIEDVPWTLIYSDCGAEICVEGIKKKKTE